MPVQLAALLKELGIESDSSVSSMAGHASHGILVSAAVQGSLRPFLRAIGCFGESAARHSDHSESASFVRLVHNFGAIQSAAFPVPLGLAKAQTFRLLVRMMIGRSGMRPEFPEADLTPQPSMLIVESTLITVTLVRLAMWRQAWSRRRKRSGSAHQGHARRVSGPMH